MNNIELLNSKMTAIADGVRELSGSTDKMGLGTIVTKLNDGNNEIAVQEELLEQVLSELQGVVDPELYNKGYNDGYADGRNIWVYVKNLEKMFEYSEFPTGTHIELDVPNLTANVMNYVFRSATGVESIKLKSNKRDTPMNWHSAFSRCFDLKVVDLTEFNTTFNTSSDVFYGCAKLEEIRGEIENTANTWTLWFTSCSKLREVRFKPNSIRGNLDISPTALLSAESIQSIVDGLADLTDNTSFRISFHVDVKAKLTEEQLATITAKNWTV